MLCSLKFKRPSEELPAVIFHNVDLSRPNLSAEKRGQPIDLNFSGSLEDVSVSIAEAHIIISVLESKGFCSIEDLTEGMDVEISRISGSNSFYITQDKGRLH